MYNDSVLGVIAVGIIRIPVVGQYADSAESHAMSAVL